MIWRLECARAIIFCMILSHLLSAVQVLNVTYQENAIKAEKDQI